MTDTIKTIIMENPFEILESRLIKIERIQNEILGILNNEYMDRLIDYKQLSKETGLAVQTLRQKKSYGEIPFVMVAGAVRFRRSEVVFNIKRD